MQARSGARCRNFSLEQQTMLLFLVEYSNQFERRMNDNLRRRAA